MIRALILMALGLAAPAAAQDCRDQKDGNIGYTVCEVDMTEADLRLFLNNEAGELYGQFGTIDQVLGGSGKKLSFAMNAGMYHDDRSPVGYYVEDGNEVMHVVPGPGPGNFGLVPNGVFCIRDMRADVIETLVFLEGNPVCSYATQSGPMLVIDGEIHPRFLPDGTSRFVRNGVGTTADGKRAVFVMSRHPVTFYEFGSFFRDKLELPSALYFDGKVSRLFAPNLGRNDPGFRLGPIVGVVVDAN